MITEPLEPTKIPYFEPIEENLYLTERRQSKEMRRMACDCTTSKEDREMGVEACGSDCLNRMLYIECGSRCACLDYCTNKRFQKRAYSNVEVFQTPWKGFGLRAVEELKTDDFVLEYVGEVLDFRGFKNKSRQYAKENQTHFYFMALNPDVMIDATVKGNISRFINHSCDPNCETQKWTVNGELRIGFFTKRTIPPGEELTFNYQFETYGQKAQKCFCGSENCRGTIGIEKPARFKSNKKKDKTKKKEEMIGVDEIEEQIERMNVEGLTNKNHVLNLCRLMVYVQQTDHRIAILKILQNTPEPACLRLFVEYHGLPLLWSWMADLNQEPASEFQFQVLSLLSELPITNRTILQDSKILSIIEKWTETSEAESYIESYTELPPPPPGMTPVGILSCTKDTKEAKDKLHKKRVTFAEEEPSSDSEMSDINCIMAEASSTISISAEGIEVSGTDNTMEVTGVSSEGNNSGQDVEQSDEVESSQDTVGDVPQHEADSSGDTREKKEGEYLIEGSATEEESQDDESSSDSQDKPTTSISTVASKLLEHWSNLKEVFKIPRKERVEERKRTEQELGTFFVLSQTCLLFAITDLNTNL
ncbi:hypothetical protein LOTGIDRAFT_227153 [Lottia gigantea]|uniref:Histone-lysine N-methyltransferase SETD2 n=1 Tax=Lottia gigantea TaxID=225164 RepID=V4AGD4_LOTGI|nr:hypothetical protein LOTGIDRAFT_227153 [Lottia gigantea]ESO95937.1 hypothetical protein LOTGIDRAFT_227153 [Lottia gigantea]